MKNTDALTALINKTSDKVLGEWAALAKLDGVNVDDYIGDRLDEMALTDWEACKTLSGRNMQRILRNEGLVA